MRYDGEGAESQVDSTAFICELSALSQLTLSHARDVLLEFFQRYAVRE
jgi:hypothetical protein